MSFLFFFGGKVQRQRVDAEAFAGRRWAVVEDMTEVRIAAGTTDFCAVEAIACVFKKINTAGKGFVKSRPSAAGVKFALGRKEGITAGGTGVSAVLVKFVITAREHRFGAFFTQNMVLLGCEAFFEVVLFHGGTFSAGGNWFVRVFADISDDIVRPDKKGRRPLLP